jgi:hypothetical protein
MPIFSEVMSGGVLGNGSAVVKCYYNPLAEFPNGVILTIHQSDLYPNQARVNRLNVQANGLQHWWRFDHAEGNTVYDPVSGYEGDIVSSDPDLNWEYDNKRLSFVWTNSNQDYIDLPVAPKKFLNGISQFTLSAWVYFSDLSNNQPIISRDSIAGNNYFHFGWDKNAGIVVKFNDIVTNAHTRDSPTYVTTGTWYHVAVVYNGNLTDTSMVATNLKRLKIFINGIQQTITYSGGIPGVVTSSDKNFFIGKAAEEYFNGKLDDIRFYDRALTNVEVKSISQSIQTAELLKMPVIAASIADVKPSAIILGGAADSEEAASPLLEGIDLRAGRVAGEDADIAGVYDISPSGEILASGGAIATSSYMPSGGAVLNGSADLSLGFAAFGGVYGAGGGRVNGITNEPPFGEVPQGVLLGGSGIGNNSKQFSATSVGTVFVGGVSNTGVPTRQLNSSGEIVVSGASDLRFVFTDLIRFNWNVRKKISKSYKLLWNVGRLQIFWYRIISKGVDGNGCPLIGNPCCQKYIVNVHARSLAELCGKLSKRKYKFPIESVERFSRPAENSEVAKDEANGIDHTCQKLIPVEICSIPQCADFCVENDVRQEIGFSMKVQVNSFLEYEAVGSAFSGGSAETRYTKNLPNYPYVGSGTVVVAGNSVFATDSYTMKGGIFGGGSSLVKSTRYSYVGGVWPNVTSERFGTSNNNAVEQEGDQAWALPERVNKDDGLYSQTDISYGKKSQRLITTGFGLNVPSWARVISLRVFISRLATQIAIRDVDVYLVRNGRQISDNLADTVNDWPLIETRKVYGNTPTNNRPSFRDPNADFYLGEFTPDDLNDPTFGVALRVKSRQLVGSQLAKINSISVEAYYELVNGSIVRVVGESPARSQNYHYQTSGKTVLASVLLPRLGYRFKSTGLGSNGSGELSPGGRGAIRYDVSMSGGIVAGGNSKVTPFFETMTGGVRSSGEARATPFFDTMTGGVRLSGQSKRNYRIHYVGSGSFVLGSNSFIPEAQYRYLGSGLVVLESDTRVRSNAWKWASSGNTVFILGSAGQKASSIGTPVQEMSFGMTILQITAAFIKDVQANDVGVLTGSVQKCGCEDIGLRLQLTQNIARDNSLSKFLVRNSYEIARVLWLRYNSTNDSWQSNLHYRGQSAENSTPESWDMMFELQCTDLIGGITVGRQIWKLALHITRKNLATRETFETRVVVGILPDAICGVKGSKIDFNVVYDTQAELAVVTPSATIYQNTIYDNIGLFRNRSWIDDPNLNLKISQEARERPVSRVDLTRTVTATS